MQRDGGPAEPINILARLIGYQEPPQAPEPALAALLRTHHARRRHLLRRLKDAAGVPALVAHFTAQLAACPAPQQRHGRKAARPTLISSFHSPPDTP